MAGASAGFQPQRATEAEITKIVAENVSREARLFTDESKLYGDAKKLVAEHDSVKHSAGEYVRGEVHTNSVEGFFGIFKRGMRGIYQQCAEKHLHRYLAEFDFRYNNRIRLGVNDVERADRALAGIGGKRLIYRTARVGEA